MSCELHTSRSVRILKSNTSFPFSSANEPGIHREWFSLPIFCAFAISVSEHSYLRGSGRRNWHPFKAARVTERTMEEIIQGGSREGKVCLFCPPNTRTGNWGGSQRCESAHVIGGRGRCAPHGAEGNLFSLGDRACCHGAPRPIGGGVVQWGGGFIIENFLSLERGALHKVCNGSQNRPRV